MILHCILKMQNKWTLEEEKQLVFKLRSGAQMKDIAEISGRSYGAIKERLKKIIFENIKNINNNDEVQRVSKYLNLDFELVKKYYLAYGERIEDEKQGQQKQEIQQGQQKQEIQHGQQKQEIQHGQQKQEIQPQINQTGGTNMTLKRQNELLEDIIKNQELKKKIGDLIKKKQLDKDSKEVLKKILFQ